MRTTRACGELTLGSDPPQADLSKSAWATSRCDEAGAGCPQHLMDSLALQRDWTAYWRPAAWNSTGQPQCGPWYQPPQRLIGDLLRGHVVLLASMLQMTQLSCAADCNLTYQHVEYHFQVLTSRASKKLCWQLSDILHMSCCFHLCCCRRCQAMELLCCTSHDRTVSHNRCCTL